MTFLRETRQAARTLLQSPAFTTATVLVLALGIGANTAIFSVVNTVLLRPLPFADPGRLVTVWEDYSPNSRSIISAPEIGAYTESSHALSGLAALDQVAFTLTGAGDPEQVRGALASASLFPLLGVRPVLGRAFTAADDRPGAGQVALLTHEFWKRRFGSDPSVIGRTLDLHMDVQYGPDRPRPGTFTVIGVLPPGFRVPFLDDDVHVWAPIAMGQEQLASDNHYLFALGRLAPGASLGAAQRELRGLSNRRQAEQRTHRAETRVDVVPLSEVVIGDVRPALLVLLAAVGLVLLAACANLANLQLVRGTMRRREVAIRSALGARRGRIVRQLLGESLLLALAGGALGTALAEAGVRLVRLLGPADLPRLSEVAIDGRVLAFTAALSLVTALLFGLAPALSAARADLNDVLKEGGRSQRGDRRGERTRSLLAVVEITLAVLLLAGAGLLVRSFVRLQAVDMGFDAENALTFHLSLPESRYPTPESREVFTRELLTRLEALPGARSAATTTIVPLAGWNSATSFEIEGRPPVAVEDQPVASIRGVSPGYFRTLGEPVVRGRPLTDRDMPKETRAVAVNETMARRFWAGEDPIGRRLRLSGEDQPWMTVAAVVGDERAIGPDADPPPAIYVPSLRNPSPDVVVRTKRDPASLAPAVRRAVLSLDPDQPISNVSTLEASLDRSLAQRRFNALLLGIFAGLAVVLASIGLYGILAYSVAERTQEIGVRMALGARGEDVLRLVLGRGARLVGTGVALGLLAAAALGRALSSLLYGVSATDPTSLAAAAALLASVAIFASWLPARRATRLSPLATLRQG